MKKLENTDKIWRRFLSVCSGILSPKQETKYQEASRQQYNKSTKLNMCQLRETTVFDSPSKLLLILSRNVGIRCSKIRRRLHSAVLFQWTCHNPPQLKCHCNFIQILPPKTKSFPKPSIMHLFTTCIYLNMTIFLFKS